MLNFCPTSYEQEGSQLKFIFFTYRLQILVLLLAVFTFIGVIFVYNGNVMGFIPNANLQGTPIYNAFSSPEFIYVGLIINFSLSIPSAFDLIVDIFDPPIKDDSEGHVKIEHESWMERMYLVVINIFCSVFVLFYRNDVNVPYIYACTHALQYVFCMGVILLLCNKLAPAHFHEKNILLCQLFFGLASITSMMGFGHNILYWPNLLTFFWIALFLYFFFYKILFWWLKNLRTRVIYAKEAMSVEERCCLWYLGSAALVILFVPCIVAAMKLFDWSLFEIFDVYVFIYSYTLFTVITSSVPARLTKAAVEDERRKVSDMKRSLLRYISHEVRSPLNVIYSGVKFILEDLSTLANSREKELILDTLGNIQQACTDVLYTMNDILQLENMSSGTFALLRTMIHCRELNEMMELCGIAAREKGVNFTVNNLFNATNLLGQHHHHDHNGSGGDGDGNTLAALQDIESGAVVDFERPPVADTFIYADGHKIGQVLRNLVANAIKFTPQNESITVNIRPATMDDRADKDFLNTMVSESPSTRASRRRRSTSDKYTPSDSESGYDASGDIVVEVIDTGVGIAKDSKARIFGSFSQIASIGTDNLEGGEGSGLGLWVSQEIVKHHGSLIQYYSDGIGQGTRFYFTLHGYRQTAVQGEDSEHLPEILSNISPQLSSNTKIHPEVQNIFSKEGSVLPPEAASKDPLTRIRERKLCSAGLFKVLVVDDSALNVKVMVRLLKSTLAKNPTVFSRSGHGNMCSEVVDIDHDLDAVEHESPVVMEIVDADDGQTAVAKVAEAAVAGQPFDAVFMDNIMNHMNGPDAAQLMRAGGFEGLIVGVTGNVMVTDVDGYISAGANLVLFKPINAPEILPVLKKIKQ